MKEILINNIIYFAVLIIIAAIIFLLTNQIGIIVSIGLILIYLLIKKIVKFIHRTFKRNTLSQ